MGVIPKSLFCSSSKLVLVSVSKIVLSFVVPSLSLFSHALPPSYIPDGYVRLGRSDSFFTYHDITTV